MTLKFTSKILLKYEKDIKKIIKKNKMERKKLFYLYVFIAFYKIVSKVKKKKHAYFTAKLK